MHYTEFLDSDGCTRCELGPSGLVWDNVIHTRWVPFRGETNRRRALHAAHNRETDIAGESQKDLERRFEGTAHLNPSRWTVARLDVRAGHTVTRGMDKPYDPRFGEPMQTVAGAILQSRHATAAFVQSDEITLIWRPTREPREGEDRQSFLQFGGRVSKWLSTLAGEASSRLCLELHNRGVNPGTPPHLDCRIIQGDETDVIESVRWRADDAFRNGILAAGQAWIGRQAIHGRSNVNVLKMIVESPDLTRKWLGIPPYARFGSVLVRRAVNVEIDETTRLKIPERNRPPAGSMATRSRVVEIPLDELEDLVVGAA